MTIELFLRQIGDSDELVGGLHAGGGLDAGTASNPKLFLRLFSTRSRSQGTQGGVFP